MTGLYPAQESYRSSYRPNFHVSCPPVSASCIAPHLALVACLALGVSVRLELDTYLVSEFDIASSPGHLFSDQALEIRWIQHCVKSSELRRRVALTSKFTFFRHRILYKTKNPGCLVQGPCRLETYKSIYSDPPRSLFSMARVYPKEGHSVRPPCAGHACIFDMSDNC